MASTCRAGSLADLYLTRGLVYGANYSERPRPGKTPLLDAKQEAYVIATVCAGPPEGHARWSLRMLADEVVRLSIVETISHETVRRTLKKHPEALAGRGVDY
jgi:Homeodomain-like domain